MGGEVALIDFESALEAMQEMMQLRIEIRIATQSVGGRQWLYATAVATSLPGQEQEPMSLASVSVPLSWTEYRSLDTALFRLLYLLDGKLAEEELRKTKSG